jgi:uncharacterized membrane-anchored protein
MKASMTRRGMIAGILATALLHTAALGKMVTDRAALLRNGTEVVLETGAIDPRDLFRGHYTILNLAITTIDTSTVNVEAGLEAGMTVYVTLRPGPENYWQPMAVMSTPPQDGTPAIRGSYDYGYDAQVFLRFPIDRYFAPQDRALELEALDRADRMGVILALDDRGGAAIKGLMIDGARVYEEPLF